VPFFYVAVVGIAVGNLMGKDGPLLGAGGLLTAGIIGFLVRVHMWFNRDGAARAVCWIRKFEKELAKELPKELQNALTREPSAKYRPWAFVPLEWMVSGIAGACVLGALQMAVAGFGLRGVREWVLIAVVVLGVSTVLFLVEVVLLLEANRKWQKYRDEIGCDESEVDGV
jgi:hypothetical protein